MSNAQGEPKRIYVTIIIGLLWLLFPGSWIFYYAAFYSILQNIAVFMDSMVILNM